MFSSIRRRLSYANVAMTLALVFAMTGGAFAAKHYLITSTKQISPKVLKALQGKAGADGAPGVQGLQGPAGPAGKEGLQGKEGPAGKEGAPGKNGENGKEGSPWVAGGVLPKEKTETGNWSLVANVAEAFKVVMGSVSFNIPLEAPVLAHYIRANGKEPYVVEPQNSEVKERESTVCKGNAAAPSATPGNLCVYAVVENNTQTALGGGDLPSVCSLTKATVAWPQCYQEETNNEPHTRNSDTTGFGLVTLSTEAGLVQTWGTWAVTAAE